MNNAFADRSGQNRNGQIRYFGRASKKIIKALHKTQKKQQAYPSLSQQFQELQILKAINEIKPIK